MSDLLRRILSDKHEEVRARRAKTPLAELRAAAFDMPPTRNFSAAIVDRVRKKEAAVIAEIKKASPSQGVIRPDFYPADIAASYAEHGAACLSVLTDAPYFQGCSAYLREARAAVALPVLRKDFIVDAYQIFEARQMGADAILLIVSALTDGQLRDFEGLAREVGLSVLAESHSDEELARALCLETPLMGVNNRDLRTFTVSLSTTLTLSRDMPPGRVAVAESGIHTRADVETLENAGVHAFLVGEAFMRAKEPGEALARLFGRAVPSEEVSGTSEWDMSGKS
ncbi:MAG: indole-3-glycerol phosphate synthase TrpC [Zoogloeaceae bacterium]|jgi:indole-3-glycerol phosphate synthase|nr:indole-3-glycerol phosphate synthase TrpC [Zoogloeaceae bacterium]